MSEIEFEGKWAVIFWAHWSLEIMNWMDNRKMDAEIKQAESLSEDYSRGEEEMVVYMCVAEGWPQLLLDSFILDIQKLK